ncbi:DUF5937 family protein [Micromonospora sp. NPDC005806]|uniref:ArsR/SmtB family transcription factor n=1 Tax=Micromonospora sp. NPDC005806 TaxID=3364234 RepID=UPI003698B344
MSLPPLWWSPGHDIPADRSARQRLVDTLRRCAEATVGPHWDRIRDHLAQEVARRSTQLATKGLGPVLATLHPGLRWNSPALEVDCGHPEKVTDLHLAGRGLELVPSVFYRETTPPYVSSADPAAALVLFYPVSIEAHQAIQIFRSTDPDDHDWALADLLGRSRSLVLRCLAEGCSTTELAKRTGLSLAGASQHAAVLRNARLAVTNREGGAVRHSLTPLGHRLLEQA